MKKITSSLLLLALFFSYSIWSQENFKHDIGVTLSSFDNQRIGIDYRLGLNENWKFRVGAFYGASYSNFFSTGKITSVADSLITYRKVQYGSNSGTLRIGAERKLGESLFSLSADLIIGYKNSYSSFSNNYSELDTNGIWISTNGAPPLDLNQPLGDSTRSQITRHYLVPGLAIGANFNIPIKSRFELSLRANGLITSPVFLKASNVTDPYNEFTAPIIVNTINFNSTITATFRYKFGLKE